MPDLDVWLSQVDLLSPKQTDRQTLLCAPRVPSQLVLELYDTGRRGPMVE